MSQSGIYEIRNKLNDHLYIGSAVDFAARRRLHLHQLRQNKHHSTYLQRAFNKYKEEAFVFTLIEEVPRDKDQLIERELHWIQTLRPKYNGTNNAVTRLGGKASPETIAKLREIAARPEVIAAKRAALLGIKRPPEVVDKVRWALTGKKVSERARQALREGSANRTHEQRRPMLGKRLSDLTRRRMSEAVTLEMRTQRSEHMKTVWTQRSDEDRQRILEAMRSEEATRKRSELLKVTWQDEDLHKQRSEAIKEAWQDEDLRREKSGAMKELWSHRSDEERRKYIEPTLTEEALANRSKASKAMWAERSPEERQRILGPAQSEEARRKRSATMKETLRRKRESKDQLRLPL